MYYSAGEGCLRLFGILKSFNEILRTNAMLIVSCWFRTFRFLRFGLGNCLGAIGFIVGKTALVIWYLVMAKASSTY
jgi:hypothetical protein